MSIILPERSLSLPSSINTSLGIAKTTPDVSVARDSGSQSKGLQQAESEATVYIEEGGKRQKSSFAQMLDLINWSQVLFLIWFAGASFFLLRTGIGVAGLFLIAHAGKPLAGKEWKGLFEHCQRRLNVARQVTLRASRIVTVPVTFGLFHPIILLPLNADEWSADLKETVLFHEMAHIKRLDFLSNLAAQIVCAFCWHIPLAWFTKRKLQIERERACDDHVINMGASHCEYADHLLEIARSLPQKRFVCRAAIGAAQRSELKQRIQHILDSHIPRHTVTRASVMASVIAVMCFAMPLAVMRLTGEDSFERKDSYAERALPEAAPSDAGMLANTSEKLALEELIALLNSNDPALKAQAALALGESKDKRAVELLIAALQDENSPVRENVIRALGSLADKRAFYSLVRLLRASDPIIRRASVWALGEIGCDPALVSVAATLTDPDPSVREAVVEVLGRCRKEAVGRRFSKLLYDYNPNARSYVVEAVGRFEDSTIIETLRAALKDESLNVRQSVARALARLEQSGEINPPADSSQKAYSQSRIVSTATSDEARY